MTATLAPADAPAAAPRTARAATASSRTGAVLAFAVAALAVIDREIDDEVRGSPVWRATEDLLTSVPGIGRITARTLIAEAPELGSIDRRRLAAHLRTTFGDHPRFHLVEGNALDLPTDALVPPGEPFVVKKISPQVAPELFCMLRYTWPLFEAAAAILLGDTMYGSLPTMFT